MSVISKKKHCPSCFVQIIRDLSRSWTVSGGVIRSPYKSVKLGLWWQHCHCLVWDWLLEEDHLVRILKTYWHCHHQIHWWTVPVPVTVYCVQLWRVSTLRTLEERAAGQDQIEILVRGDTYTVTRPHSINITRYTRYDHMTDSGWSEENSYAGHLSCWCETCTSWSSYYVCINIAWSPGTQQLPCL